MNTFIIPVICKDDLSKKLEKLNKKAAAYGNKMVYHFGNEMPVTRNVYAIVDTPQGKSQVCTGKETVFGIELTIDSDIIRKGDYTIVCSIDHDPAGNIVSKLDDSYPTNLDWYTLPPYCEHCGTRHAKRHTFIVKDAAGNCKQVGKACLKDYCGIDPAMIAASQQITDLITSEYDIDSYDFTGTGEYAYPTWSVIAIANDIINEHGYIKSDENNSTKSRLLKEYGMRDPSEKSIQLAKEMKDVFSGIDYTDLTDYQRNIKSMLACEYVRKNSFGYLAYAPIMYKKMIEKQARDKAQADAKSASNYIGKIGEKLTADIKESRLVTSWETVYGMTHLYKFVTSDNNTLVWYASKCLNGDPKKITGTVKDHKEYDGEKQTVITRCKVM